MGSAQISTIETLPNRYSPTSGARKNSPTAGATRRDRSASDPEPSASPILGGALATRSEPAATLVTIRSAPLTRPVDDRWMLR